MTRDAPDAISEQAAVTRTRLMLVAVVLPLLIACAAALLIISWLPTLPAQIAMHWGAQGVDGVGSPWQIIATLLGVVGLFVGVMAFSLGELPESGRPKFTLKILAVTSLWLSVMLSVGITGSVAVQRGMSDAFAAPDPAPWVLLGAGLGLLIAAGAWFVLPKADRTPPYAIDVDPLDVVHTERVFWTGTVSMARGVLFVMIGAALLLVTSVVVAALGGAAVAVIGLLVAIVILAIVLTTVRWRVSVGSHGAAVTSFAGWPAVRISLDDLAAVRLIAVNPLGDFGGWGWRWAGAARIGIIMQAGPAIELTRRNGSVLVVPIDDAATAVAVLQAVLSQPTNSN